MIHKKKSLTLTGLTWCTNKAVAVYFPLGVAVFAFFGIALQVTCDETLWGLHSMKLNPYNCFQYAIEKLKSSGNIDSPEGGLDALVQVAACGKVH